MLRFFLLSIAPLALLLVLLTTASLAIGGLHPAHPMSTQLTWCESQNICWLGITSIDTPIADARYALEMAGYQATDANYYTLQTPSTHCLARVMPVASDTSLIGALGIQCNELRLSEIMRTLGEPDRVGTHCDGSYVVYYGRNFFINIGTTLSPNQPVEWMVLSRILTGYYERRWYGFALPWRYAESSC